MFHKRCVKSKQKGFSLVEMVVATGVATVVMLGAGYMFMTLSNTMSKSSGVGGRSSVWNRVHRLGWKITGQVRLERFDLSRSYYMSAAGVPTRMDPGFTRGENQLIAEVDIPSIRSESTGFSFIESTFASLDSAGVQSLFSYIDSFSSEIYEMRTESVAGQASPVLRKVTRSLVLARCVPNDASLLGPLGETVDSQAPGKSAVYVMQLNRVPFPRLSGGSGDPAVCCPIDVGPSCSDGELGKWRPRVYNIGFTPIAGSTRFRPSTIQELPEIGEVNDVWGAGLMVTFDRSSSPSSYLLRLFLLDHACRTRLNRDVQDCQRLQTLPQAGSTEEATWLNYIRDNVMLFQLGLRGTVALPLSNSGTMDLSR